MTVSEAIWMRVASLGAVATAVDGRIYRARFPQHPVYPAVLVREIDDVSMQHLRGPVGIVWGRVQIDVAAQEIGDGTDAKGQADAIAAAVHGDGLGPLATGVQGFIGRIGSPGVTILGAFRQNRLPAYEPGERRVVLVQQDYRVCYRAA